MTVRSIKDIITGQEVASLPPDAMVWEAANSMNSREIGAVLVVKDGHLEGIFTERDLVRFTADADFDLARATLSEVMTPTPDTAPPDTSPSDALWRMDRGGFRHLPIVDSDGDILGVVSRRDFF